MSQAIDSHAHYTPHAILEAIGTAPDRFGVSLIPSPSGAPPALAFEDGSKVRPFFPRLVESEPDRLAAMAGMGIDRQVLSVWTDMYGFRLPAEKAVRWHRMLNDAFADLCRRHPASFSWLATGALQDPAAAAQELRRAVRDGGAAGAAAPANFAGVNLGEMELDPWWAAAAELDVPVLVHPVELAPGPRVQRWGLTQIAQYTYDTTLAAGTLVASGVMDRFPGLKVFLPHGGGAFPWLSGRFDCMHGRLPAQAAMQSVQPPSAYLRRFYYDTILHDPKLLRVLVDLVGPDRVMLGTDDSFPPADRDPLATLQAAGLPAGDAAAITSATARGLFRL
jgi:aminocarboxymuconate-semialdehyde decarboxylase